MGFPIGYEKCGEKGLPREPYNIVRLIDHTLVKTDSGPRPRSAMVLKVAGYVGLWWFVPDVREKVWKCVRVDDTMLDHTLSAEEVEGAIPLTQKKTATVVVKAPASVSASPREEWHGNTKFRIFPDGRWVEIERRPRGVVPARVSLHA